MIDLSVIAPCLNEAGNVDELVSRTLQTFDRAGINGQLVLVDDGSTDTTWARIQACRGADVRVIAVRHPQNRGIVPAWVTGLHASLGQRVCLIDSDLQNRPEDIALLYAAHGNDDDVVQGVRQPAAGMIRVTFSRTLNTLLNAAFWTRLHDNKSGFLLCRREVLERILTHRNAYKYFQSFVGVSAVARGYRIIEVNTIFDLRQRGTSFLPRLPVRASSRILWELMKFRIEVGVRRGKRRQQRAGANRQSQQSSGTSAHRQTSAGARAELS